MMGRTGAGEPGGVALEALFRSEYGRLVRALSVSTGDVERARDAVQDAFVQASRHWATVSRYDDPALWLRRVAVHRVLDQRRGDQRRDARSEREVRDRTAPLAVRSVRDSDASERSAERLDLRRALDRLPPKQRLVITLHYLADLSVQQVAEALEIAPGTVKSQLSDARRNLLEHVEVRDGR